MKVPISVLQCNREYGQTRFQWPSQCVIDAVTSSQTRWLMCEPDLEVSIDEHKWNELKVVKRKRKKNESRAETILRHNLLRGLHKFLEVKIGFVLL